MPYKTEKERKLEEALKASQGFSANTGFKSLADKAKALFSSEDSEAVKKPKEYSEGGMVESGEEEQDFLNPGPTEDLRNPDFVEMLRKRKRRE